MSAESGRGIRGFTLIEMIIVISMILVLLSIALPFYNQSIRRAKEATFHHNLVTLNKAIGEFALNKNKAPQTLEELVPDYLKFIPDDITGSNTWVTEAEDFQDATDPNQPGIKSVHSASNELSLEGKEYSSYTH